MSIAAHWKHDCQGKQDFDGPIVVVSTRYWPPGHFAPQTRPSAHSSIILRDMDEDHDRTIAQETFTAASGQEVQSCVERWVNEQRDRIILALEREFGNSRLSEGGEK